MKTRALFLVLTLALASGCTNPYLNQIFVTVENDTEAPLYIAVAGEGQIVAPGGSADLDTVHIVDYHRPVGVVIGFTAEETYRIGELSVRYGNQYNVRITYNAIAGYGFTIEKR